MPATLDVNVTVNVLDSPGAVTRKDFGTPLHATDDVTGGFTERIRYYESNTEAQADGDLGTATKAALASGFSQSPRPRRLAVGRVAYVSLSADLDAVRAEDDAWYGLDLASRVQADIEAGALWAEANDKLFLPQSSDAALLAGTGGNVGLTLQAALYDRTALLYHSPNTEHAAMAWLSGRLAIDPDDKATIWAYDQLAGIAVDSITTTEKNNVLGADANVYIPFKGSPATWAGTLASGRYIDQRTTSDWLGARLEERLAQVLLDATARGEKVPYDNDGIGMMANQVLAQLRTGERIGHFRAGSSSVDIPDISDIAAAAVQARQLTLSAETVLAGAIQEVTVNITVLVTV